MKVEIQHLRSGKVLHVFEGLSPDISILQIKKLYQKQFSKYYPDRQQFKTSQDRKAKSLKDEDTLQSLGIKDGGVLFFKDLGIQLGWSTVFLCEYAGPLVVYLLPYLFPFVFYDSIPAKPILPVVNIAAVCWSFHYLKRIYETIFVHRFSHNTMPIRNLFKNCSYYWGAAAFVSYFTNHPLYTPPCYGNIQIYSGLFLFLLCEVGNYSSHAALRDLRPPGSRERRIPYPTSDPFTFLFKFVSCPNYTYETGAWLGFAIMTQSLPALLFMVAGFYQMAVWGIGKHRRYLKEFKDYPRSRKAIVPFLI